VKNILLAFFLYILILAQVGFGRYFPIHDIWINFTLLATLVIAIRTNNKYRLFLLMIWSGFLLDVFTHHHLGPAILSLIIFGAIIQALKQYFNFQNLISFLACLTFLSLAYNPFAYLINFLSNQFLRETGSIILLNFSQLMIQTCYHLILFLIIWLIVPVRFKAKLLHESV
jgi:hypothetical protein